MTTPPFLADTDPTLDPFPRVRDNANRLTRFYLGRAGNLIQLPSPALTYPADPSQGESVKSTLAGVQTVNRMHPVMSKWALSWTRLAGRDWQIVNGFYRRAFGPGPWFLVTPDVTNRLSEAASLGATGWAVSVGTLADDPTVTAPVVPAGVARWVGAGSASLASFGTLPAGVPTPDPLLGPPCVVQEPCTVSLYARVASGTAAVRLRASGRMADGTLTAEFDSGPRTLTSSAWTRLATTVGPGDLAAAEFVLPVLVCNTASAPDILVCAAQLEYADEATDWGIGEGSPRVTCSALTRTVDGSLMRNVTMSLG